MAKRGRPAMTVPDVGPMNVLDVFLTFKKKGVSTQQAASAAMYAVVGCQVGWDNLGLSRTRVYETRKLLINLGINPDRIEAMPLSEKYQKELAAAMKASSAEITQKEFREASGIPETKELKAELAPLRFVEPGPVVKI